MSAFVNLEVDRLKKKKKMMMMMMMDEEIGVLGISVYHCSSGFYQL